MFFSLLFVIVDTLIGLMISLQQVSLAAWDQGADMASRTVQWPHSRPLV